MAALSAVARRHKQLLLPSYRKHRRRWITLSAAGKQEVMTGNNDDLTIAD